MKNLYCDSLALLNDLYQLTMAYGYHKAGRADHEAIFHLYFRRAPFESGYTVACGLDLAIDYLESFKFDSTDIEYLATLENSNGTPLFDDAFLKVLSELRFTGDIDAFEEGTPAFPNEPLVRVRGPLMECQLLETPLLNIINFQTLVATKAARICEAAQGDPVLEFGLRRAQGIDGGVSASRAAYIGGCAATSNVLAGKLYGIPVKGTHAHSWVMSFDTELESFRAWADAMPDNAVFLVDTYDTLDGVKRAVEVGKELRERGHEMAGIRLDSGDLAYLSIQARRILDEAGFEDANIVASNSLDEETISSLKAQGSKISIWGVGTRLATAYDQPALGGVYKLAATRAPGGEWKHQLKLSEQVTKTSNPGQLGVRRYFHKGDYIGDLIYDELTGLSEPEVIVDPTDFTRRKLMPEGAEAQELLKPIYRNGDLVYDRPSLKDTQARTRTELQKFYPGVRRLLNPHEYPVGFDLALHELKTQMILEARGFE